MSKKIKVIAEIGINHNGDIKLAKEMIDLAVKYDCYAVKFQKRTIDVVYTKDELDVPRKSPFGTINRQQKEALEFGKDEYDEIDRYCKENDIMWFASAWDLDSQRFLQQYNLKLNKVASAMLTYDDLLHMIAAEGKHTYISTGMSRLEQVDHAVEIFRQYDCPFTIMSCTSTYPTPIEECNIRAVQSLRLRYPDSVGIGYSGHEIGVLPSILSVALGADVIERHITIDNTGNLYGSDQTSSLGPDGLRRLVRDANLVSDMLGDGLKVLFPSEVGVMKKLRRF